MILPIFPIFLLGIALYSIYWYQKGSGELLRVLAAGTAAICTLWGFAIAHWTVLLFGLILLLPSKRAFLGLATR